MNAEAKSRVQRFDQEGRFLGSFETDPMPGGLALDKDGLLYVSHMMKHKVAVYDPAGKLVREFGKQGAAPGEFDQPGGIAFGPRWIGLCRRSGEPTRAATITPRRAH